MVAAEFFHPGQLVELGGAPEPLDVGVGKRGPACQVTQLVGHRRWDVDLAWAQLAVCPGAHLRDVVRAACLGTWAHDGLLPAAEGLTLDNGAGDAAVDVGVADLDVVDPVLDLIVVEGVDAAGQTVAGGVLPLDGLLEGFGVHDAEHWAEALVEVEPGARLHTIADAWGPQGAFLIELFRLEQPALARLQLGKAAQQLLAWCLGQAVHGGGDVIAWAYLEGAHGVEKLAAQALGGTGCADEDDQGGSGALLTRVAECGEIKIRNSQVRVRSRGDDERVFAGGLRHEVHLWTPGAEELAGIGCAGQDDSIDIRVGDESLACFALIGEHELDEVAVEAVLLQRGVYALDCHLGTVDNLWRRLDDDGGTRS